MCLLTRLCLSIQKGLFLKELIDFNKVVAICQQQSHVFDVVLQ